MTELWPLCLDLVLLTQPVDFLFGVECRAQWEGDFLLCELNMPCSCTGQVMTTLCSPQLSPYRSHCMFGRRLGPLTLLRLSCSSITMKWALALSSASVWSLVFQIAYAAVDCAKGQNHDLCKQEGVDGYPTFNYYNYGKFVEKYTGDRGVSESKSHHLVQVSSACPALQMKTAEWIFTMLEECWTASVAVLHGLYHNPVHLCIRNTLGLFLGTWEEEKGLDLVMLFVYFIL